MAYAPIFIGSTERSASQYSDRQSLRNHLLEVQDDKNVQENEIKDNALSSHHGENSLSRSKVSSLSIRRTYSCSKGPNYVTLGNAGMDITKKVLYP